MIDRLISGAGAWADAADRLVRRFVTGSLFETRPGSLLVAAALAIAAVVAVVGGLESTTNPDPREIAPATVASSSDIGSRTWATMRGRMPHAYVETYPDENENGVQDPDEKGERWFYFLVGADDMQGVVVRSARPPTDLFRFDVRGTIARNEAYVAEDAQILSSTIRDLGVDLDESAVIDTTIPGAGTPRPLDLGAIPPDGTAVSFSGAGIGYIAVCSNDTDGDGVCTLEEADLWDLLLFDPSSRKAIIGILEESPELVDATFTGMLRRDPAGVSDARTADELDFASLGIEVADDLVLDDGAKPASAPLMFALATALGILGAIVALGWAGGYLIYRRRPESLPSAATTLAVGERLPLRVSGVLITPSGRIRVREVPAALVRFPIGPVPATTTGSVAPMAPTASMSPEPGPVATGIDTLPLQSTPAAGEAFVGASSRPDPEQPTTLIVERDAKPHGIALGMGEVDRMSIGRVLPFRGARPAVRVVAGTGPILLSFGSEAERDRAAAELLDETGLIRQGEGMASRPREG